MQVLSQLPAQTDPRLLVGHGHFDDAGVAAVDERLALVQTVDFFPPVVDDPWWFGRIAAANALSDVYAMGARPFSALNIVVFPTDTLPLDVLATILKGGCDALAEAGAMMLGGHSVSDEGVKYGVAVTGLVTPGAQVTNGGARPGDLVFLTKPLGTGSLTTAARKRKCDEAHLQAAMRSMGALNRGASEAMVQVGVHAATDVTGYGLAGHGHELAAASGVELRLRVSALPVLAGAREALARGLQSGGAARTTRHLGERLAVEPGVSELDVRLVTDSETSGGLLIAVESARGEALRAALAAAGAGADLVGEIGPAVAGGRVRLTP